MDTVNLEYLKNTTIQGTEYNISLSRVPQADLLFRETYLDIPRFTNNDDVLCPLTYRLSSSNLEFSEFTDIAEPELIVVDDEEFLEVTIPFTEEDRLKNKTWEFYLNAINRDRATEYTHKITVRKEPLCASKVGAINNNPPNLLNDTAKWKTRPYKVTNWAEDYIGADIPYV